MTLNRVTPPAEEPVTVAEAKLHLRLETAVDDALVAALIVAAREYAEQRNGRAFVTQTWALTLDAFPGCIELPKLPAGAVTAITYIDANGAPQTLSAATYQLVKDRFTARVVPKYGLSWPSARAQEDAVTITWTAGYGAPEAVPATIRQAILMLVAHWYEHREAVGTDQMYVIPMAVDSLLAIDRVFTF